jgi:hypothetical protein
MIDFMSYGENSNDLLLFFNYVVMIVGKNPTLTFAIVVGILIFLWYINKRLRGKDKY